MKKLSLFVIMIFALSCSTQTTEYQNNSLTKDEIKEGWKLLFDGESTVGWHSYQKNAVGAAWKAQDGTLMLDNSNKDDRGRIIGGGDLVTDNEYENFELKLEWKISPCGNSGLMFNVSEDASFGAPYHTGPEMQVLDNTCHPDAKIITHRAGDLYDLIACSEETVKPAGEWNEIKIRIDRGISEFWMNGTKVVEFTMWNDEWNRMVAESKFKSWKSFGQMRKGKLVLQDHTDPVWFRNIKIREL